MYLPVSARYTCRKHMDSTVSLWLTKQNQFLKVETIKTVNSEHTLYSTDLYKSFSWYHPGQSHRAKICNHICNHLRWRTNWRTSSKGLWDDLDGKAQQSPQMVFGQPAHDSANNGIMLCLSAIILRRYRSLHFEKIGRTLCSPRSWRWFTTIPMK